MFRRRNRCRFGAALAAAWVAATCGPPASAQAEVGAFDRVVEDWELVVDRPDLIAEGPQITTTMSPSGDISDLSMVLNLNYRSRPSYRAGGMELVAYRGERALGGTAQHQAQLSFDGERIAWSQSMRLTWGALVYEIIDGTSTSWGKFGQGSGTNLGLMISPGVATLSNYRPDFSVEHSGVGWQGDRVTSMRLVRVRYYLGSSLVAVDESPRVVGIER